MDSGSLQDLDYRQSPPLCSHSQSIEACRSLILDPSPGGGRSRASLSPRERDRGCGRSSSARKMNKNFAMSSSLLHWIDFQLTIKEEHMAASDKINYSV